MFTVFLGRQNSLDRPVLIKRLNSQWLNEKDLLERFRREALICARLKHANIVNIIDVSSEPDNLYLIIEYIEGWDLEKFVDQYHPLPFDLILYITREILSGLAYAHSQGVIHRDIKPSNIMVSRGGIVKITDFGLAKTDDLPSVSLHGEVVGTPAYMSPEQAQVSGLDQRTDLFSLGTTIYELAGQPSPFRGKNLIDSVQKLVKEKPAPLMQFRGDIPVWFSELVETMLNKKPQKRPDSADTVLEMDEFKQLNAAQPDLAAFIKTPQKSRRGDGQPALQPSHKKQLSKPAIATIALVCSLLLFLFSININLNAPDRNSEQPVDTHANPSVQVVDSISGNPKMAEVEDTSGIRSLPEKQPENTLREQRPPQQISGTSEVDSDDVQMLIKETIVENSGQKDPEAAFLAENGSTERNEVIEIAELMVFCSPWADVFIDGQKKDTTPLKQPIVLSAGAHTVELINPKFPRHRQEINLAVNQIDTITVNFHMLEGYLNLQVTPWAKVYIDEQYYEDTPLKNPIPLAPGKYKIKLVNPVYTIWSDSIEIVAQETILRQIILEK